ncbi:MAG: metal ABC transporter permease [Solobacterium sp.]|jgi:zinc transport system permease protein|nr:metal ABC transporter permease [Solobacterium sp.]MCH4205965.1 metal ABC transporter permease [Solobacterium sp.]MCH4227427.1 metal ABC transporter permease [Solobacterium sp.]MCH4282796.1 metal ABC transporter permease [Solobacterium sp.]
MLAKLYMYLQYPFVVRAIIAGVLISFCASLLGVILVLRRYSYIGDCLSHVAFGAMSVSYVAGIISQKLFVILPITAVTAVLILRTKQKRVQGDALIAMLSTAALAIGYLLMNVFPISANVSSDVCTSLFGSTSILTLSQGEVWESVILAVIVSIIILLLYPRIFAVTFDEEFAQATGIHTDRMHLILAIVTSAVVVLAMNLVGSILISALVIFPALSAMQIERSFGKVLILSCILAVCGALAGLIGAILAGTPVGATIVICDLAIFLICFAIGLLKQ